MTSTETTTKQKWATQTWVVKTFGISAVVVGRILTAAGFKQGSEATPKALLADLAKKSYTADGLTYYRWDLEAVTGIVEEALVLHGGPPIHKLERQIREMLDDADRHRADGDDCLADLMEDQAYADIPPGMARVIRRRLAD